MKKILALVLAFAMMFSTITVAFAEPEVSAEAKALATVGMLAGDGNGVTVEYTAKEMTRLTAAASLLKLKGLYADAVAFVGDANFADADAVKWVEGKNILAYLKANPGLGFGGNEKGEFNPNGNITEQSYYKVLLETLGYKQTTAEVAGDFAWEETLTFAEGKGLKAANAEKFTVDALAKATVAALKAEMKDGKVLINVLVEAGKVDKEKAVAAELIADKPVVTAALKSAKAIGNTVVEATFDAEINEGATDVALYTIEGLEIKSAILNGTKKVLLETESQKAGTKYTLVVGEVKANFGGVSKVTGAPNLDKAVGTDTETVELTFDKVLDFVSATDTANYQISNVTVEKAELDSTRKVVTLTTNGMASGKSYTVKVTSVKSVDGVALRSASKSFYSKSDKVAPKLQKVEAKTFKRIIVTFNELVTTESAEDIANYTIKAGSTELAIEKIVDVTGSADDVTTVEVTTDAQKSGTRYELSVNNIVDQSVLANKITRISKLTFSGKAEDIAAPVLKSMKYITRNIVKVTFDDKSRLDIDTVIDINNYTFNNDVAIEKAEQMPGADEDSYDVLLYVSDLGGKSSYELKAIAVRDEYGNEMKEKKISAAYIKANVTASTRVDKVVATKATEVKVYFSKEIDATTAKDVANYSINNDIGTPIAAKVSSDCTYVTLTTPTLTAGKAYTITINNVKDLGGVTLTNIKPSFVALTTENDLDAPELEDIYAINKEVVRLRFSEAIKNPTTATISIRKAETTDTAILLNGRVAYDDDTVVEFSKTGLSLNLDNVDYEISAVDKITDKAGNKFAIDSTNEPTFYGTSVETEKVEMTWEQVNVKKFKLTFTEKVKLVASPVDFGGLTASIDEDDATIAYLESGSVLKVDREFKDDIATVFESNHGVKVANLDSDNETIIIANLEDTDAPYIENVEAQYRDRIVVTYNEDIKDTVLGNYTVSYFDDNGKEKNVSLKAAAQYSSTAKNKVKLDLSSGFLDANYVYTLKVTGSAMDLAGNRSEKDEEFTFMGSDLQKTGNYVKGVEVVNGTTIIVTATTWATAGETVTVVYGTAPTTVITANSVLEDAEIALPLTAFGSDNLPTAAFSKDVKYKATVGTTGSFEFYGTVDTGISVVKTTNANEYEVSYSDVQLNDYVVVVVNGTSHASKVSQTNQDNGFVTMIETATKADILVVRDGLVILYNVGVELSK